MWSFASGEGAEGAMFPQCGESGPGQPETKATVPSGVGGDGGEVKSGPVKSRSFSFVFRFIYLIYV